jgi:trimeric autotransporter adhesin
MRRVARRYRQALALVAVILAQLLVACGGGSSGSGNLGGGQPPPSNPVPAIISLSPNSANAGGTASTITITGYNFISSSSVQWNGSARTTTYTSSTQLQVQITAADIASSGTATLSVTNPTPGGGTSGSAEFTINASSNPAPSVLSMSPTSVNAGSGDIVLTINGANFLPSTVIEWNSASLTTSYLSDGQVEAQIPASSLANPGVATITIVNPPPGGGSSTPFFFGINFVPTVVNQFANDMVWDSTHQLIYLSVPSLASSYGNTIAALDPISGTVQSSQFAGSEPDVLAISSDDSYLYAGLDGSSSVQRFILPGLALDINYLLGAGPYPEGPFFGADLEVAPDLPRTTAVSRGSLSVLLFGNSNYAAGGMEVFDDAAQRPTVATEGLYGSLQWGSDTQIYAVNNEISSFDFYVLKVNSGGVSLAHDYPNEFSDFYARLHYDSGTGYAYTDDGYVINPANGQHVGQFQASGYMVPDSSLNSAFFLGQTQGQAGSTSFTIASFDLTTFAPIAEITIPNVQGNPLRFIRWGSSGLAFNDDAGFVYIINSSFVSGNAEKNAGARHNVFPVMRGWRKGVIPSRQKVRPDVRSRPKLKTRPLTAGAQNTNPVPVIAALSPSSVTADAVGNEFTLNVTGSNFVSLSTVEWNGSPRQTDLVSSTELQAQINSSDVQNAGTATVSVMTPSPGGGTSSALSFSIVPSASLPPIPSIIALNPNSAMAGSGGLLVDLSGVWLDNSDTVDWNGSPRTNTSQGFLAAQVYASDLVMPGYAQVTAVTPGGIASNAAEFQILYQPTAVNQSTNDMVWDPVNEVFYISVPSSATTNANQVCVLNPTTLAITNCQSGNEPDVLAISDESEFLYVGMDGGGLVQRFILPSLTPDISYSLGNYATGEPYFALDLQVEPGAPDTTAVSKGTTSVDPVAQGGITIHDGSTPRPNSSVGCGVPDGQCADSIQWNSDGTEIYAANSDTTSLDFYTYAVDSSGITLQQDYPSVFWNPPGRIQYDSTNGLVYCEDGFHVINPLTGLPAGLLEGGGAPVAPDSALNTVFMMVQYTYQANTNYTIELFDMTHYVPIGRIPFPTTAQLGVPPIRLLRWGSNGLALNFKGDQIYLLTGPFISNPQKARAKRIRKTVQPRPLGEVGHPSPRSHERLRSPALPS